jgi:hypothetical protein
MTNDFNERPEPVSGMQWQAVESSQISEIGYESGVDYPLGIKFPPNKKQIAAGEPGSEYHYADVPPWMHRNMLKADDIYSYFKENIKSHPDVHPYTKVKADPTEPTPKKTSGTVETSTTSGEQAILTGIDSPSIALAIIDTITDDLLFTPGAVTDAQLAVGRDWYLTEAKKYDISTEKQRTELKRFARPLQKLRTGIEARAQELTGATKRKIAAIDQEKRRLVQIIGGIETEVLAPMTAWEQEEDARKIRLSGVVKSIVENTQPHLYQTIAQLEIAISSLDTYDTSTMQEFKMSAESAIAASLRVLKPELERRIQAEAAAVELEQLRAEKAERDEADRQAEEKRKEQERIDAAVEAAKVETRHEVLAEVSLALPVSVDTATDVQSFVYPEANIRFDDMPVTTVKSLPIAGMVETREQAFNREAIAGMMGYWNVDRQTAIRYLNGIKSGNIPHVTIGY